MVAIILVAVFGLALLAVMVSVQATRHQRVAEQARKVARNELWQTYISKARAARLGSALDRRQESLQAITNAAVIQASADVRSEAIAVLALTDFVLEKSWRLSEEIVADAFDRELRQYAVGWTNGDVAVHRISNNEIGLLAAPDERRSASCVGGAYRPGVFAGFKAARGSL